MDALHALRLHWEWGVDEALAEAPVNRLAPAGRAAAAPAPSAAPAAWGQGVAPAARAAGLSRRDARGPAAVAEAEAVAAAAGSLAALRAALAQFRGCDLAATATSLVFPEGPGGGVALLGDVPEEAEDRTGRPFEACRDLLGRMLGSIGLGLEMVLLVPAIPWRPPGGRPATEHELAVCAPFLRRSVVLAAPRLIVAMGATAARVATGERASLRKLRGRWVEEAADGASLASIAPVLPMFHPAIVQRQPACRKDAWADLISLRKRLDAVSLAGEAARPSS